MKFSTKKPITEDPSIEVAQKTPLVGDEWEQVLTSLSSCMELEGIAKSTKAILRRREIKRQRTYYV
jgi:hypothetical protein